MTDLRPPQGVVGEGHRVEVARQPGPGRRRIDDDRPHRGEREHRVEVEQRTGYNLSASRPCAYDGRRLVAAYDEPRLGEPVAQRLVPKRGGGGGGGGKGG